jgi:hypothetical protein
MGILMGLGMIDGCAVLVVGGLVLREHLSKPWWERSRWLRWVYLVLVTVLVGLVVAMTLVGAGEWQAVSQKGGVLNKQQAIWRAKIDLARRLTEQGRPMRAVYERVKAYGPDLSMTRRSRVRMIGHDMQSARRPGGVPRYQRGILGNTETPITSSLAWVDGGGPLRVDPGGGTVVRAHGSAGASVSAPPWDDVATVQGPSLDTDKQRSHT